MSLTSDSGGPAPAGLRPRSPVRIPAPVAGRAPAREPAGIPARLRALLAAPLLALPLLSGHPRPAGAAAPPAPAGRPLAHAALGLAGLLLLLVLWWIATDLLPAEGSFARRFSPAVALPALLRLAGGADLWLHIWVSLRRVLVGLGFALVIGVPLGLLIGASRSAAATATPAFQFLRMVSPLSWMPIAVLVFGVGDAPIYFLLAAVAVWPIMLSTAAGVQQLNPHWLLLSKSLAATGWETLTRIVLPGVLGHVLTGLRLAIGIAWIVLVPCEMLGVQAGLGYFILDTRDRLAYEELMAVILVIGVIGYALDAAARAAVGRLSPGS